jgi:Holliday junction DNA helicase RuvA
MIARLRGTLLVKRPGHVVVDIGGVGYKVLIPLSSYYDLPAEGSTTSLLIHTHVREDALTLYGFLTEVEERLFQRLISVANVGPALALKVLSGLEVGDLVAAIHRGDLPRLSAIPGVGKKTAERLVVELKDKMVEIQAVRGVAASEEPAPSPESVLRDDLVSALVNLGYPRSSADKAVGDVLRVEPGLSFELALKKGLRRLTQ